MNFHPVDGLFLLFEGDVDIGGRIQPVIEVQRMRVLHHQLYRSPIQPLFGHAPHVEPIPLDQGRFVIPFRAASYLRQLRAQLFHFLAQT